MKIGTLVVAIAGMHGCGTAPTAADGRPLTLADAGPPPQDPMLIVMDVIHERLKDPESARIRMPRPPRAVVFAKTSFTTGGAGWEMCPEVNAKNSFGAYTGYRHVFILWNSGRIGDYIDGDLGEAYCRDRNDYRLAVAA